MKKIASLTCILLAIMAGASFAAGLNLAWDTCLPSGGLQNKAVACGTDLTAKLMVGSFVPATSESPSSTTNVVDIDVVGTTMPAFWAVGSSTSSLGTRFTMGDLVSAVGSCVTWNSTGQPVDNANSHTTTGNHIRLSVVPLIGQPGNPINAGTEALAFTLSVNTSDGTASNGCGDGACIVFTSSFIEDAFNGTSETLSNPAVRNWVTWQGGTGSGVCAGATPTKKQTWGAIKALYR